MLLTEYFLVFSLLTDQFIGRNCMNGTLTANTSISQLSTALRRKKVTTFSIGCLVFDFDELHDQVNNENAGMGVYGETMFKRFGKRSKIVWIGLRVRHYKWLSTILYGFGFPSSMTIECTWIFRYIRVSLKHGLFGDFVISHVDTQIVKIYSERSEYE